MKADAKIVSAIINQHLVLDLVSNLDLIKSPGMHGRHFGCWRPAIISSLNQKKSKHMYGVSRLDSMLIITHHAKSCEIVNIFHRSILAIMHRQWQWRRPCTGSYRLSFTNKSVEVSVGKGRAMFFWLQSAKTSVSHCKWIPAKQQTREKAGGITVSSCESGLSIYLNKFAVTYGAKRPQTGIRKRRCRAIKNGCASSTKKAKYKVAPPVAAPARPTS